MTKKFMTKNIYIYIYLWKIDIANIELSDLLSIYQELFYQI